MIANALEPVGALAIGIAAPAPPRTTPDPRAAILVPLTLHAATGAARRKEPPVAQRAVLGDETLDTSPEGDVAVRQLEETLLRSLTTRTLSILAGPVAALGRDAGRSEGSATLAGPLDEPSRARRSPAGPLDAFSPAPGARRGKDELVRFTAEKRATERKGDEHEEPGKAPDSAPLPRLDFRFAPHRSPRV